MKTRRKLFTSLALLVVINCHADGSSLIGSWVDEGLSNSDGIPKYIFTINLTEVGHKIIGDYCYISNYGKRDDCNNPLIGERISTGLYRVTFDSGFGGKNGVAKIKFSDSNMQWNIQRFPQGGEYSIPQKSLLTLDNVERNTLTIITSKSFIFKEPNYSQKTKSYLIKGDKVVVITETQDNWVKVQFKNRLVGWIRKTTIR